MSRINKRALALALLLMGLVSALAEGTLIADDMIVNDTANYKTTEVAMGAYRKSVTASASVYNPTWYDVAYEGAKARFVAYSVKRGDEVKAGDLLATFTVERDEVAVKQLEIAIARAKEDFEREKKSREEALKEQTRDMSALTDANAREKAKLRVQRAKLEMEKYEYVASRAISQKEAQLAQLLKSYENQRVYAPADGVISEITYIRDNEQVSDGTFLARIYDPYDIMFYVEDEQGALKYNMAVEISVGVNKNRVTGKGVVVASYNVLPNAAAGKGVYIRATEYDADAVKNLTRPTVVFYTANLENVLVIDRKALTLSGGKYFVYKLSQDGMVSKRYVNYVAGNATTGAWLLAGVTPGEKLILD